MDSADTHFTEEQVEWYRRTVEGISNDYGHTVPSFAFYHIPIEETQNAHEAYAIDKTIGSGKQVSDVRVQNKNTGFFDTVLALGSTKALFFGHDHRNNTHINYHGVLFCYATKTGRTVYYERDSLGGNLITVYPDSSFTVERIDGKYFFTARGLLKSFCGFYITARMFLRYFFCNIYLLFAIYLQIRP